MQLLADLLAMPVLTMGTAHASALGAAALAALGAGLSLATDGTRSVAQEKRILRAGPCAPAARERYAGWKRILADLTA